MTPSAVRGGYPLCSSRLRLRKRRVRCIGRRGAVRFFFDRPQIQFTQRFVREVFRVHHVQHLLEDEVVDERRPAFGLGHETATVVVAKHFQFFRGGHRKSVAGVRKKIQTSGHAGRERLFFRSRSFCARVHPLIFASRFLAADSVLARADHTSATGLRALVYFAPVPSLCFSMRV